MTGFNAPGLAGPAGGASYGAGTLTGSPNLPAYVQYMNPVLGRAVNHASPIGLDRILRREVMLGIVREIVPPQQHIGLQLCPWLEVDNDDVIFGYAQGDSSGLIPARAEDAEAELAQKDDTFLTEGRASVLDWAVKDHYDASDVQRAREWLRIREMMRDQEVLPLTAGGGNADFAARLIRDAARRRRKLDNRIEWLIMSAYSTGAIAYNDGRIKFAVDFLRPANQQAVTPGTTLSAGNTLGTGWSNTNSDPIGDIIKIQQYMFDVYGITIKKAMISRKGLNQIMNSDRFVARSGLVVGGTPTSPIDPKYVIDGWGPAAAIAIVAQQTGVQFIEYDSVYRTRNVGSNTYLNNRFFPENRVLFMPDGAEVAEFDDTDLGMGRLLTSPHPANNWSPGVYNWDHEYGMDPWGADYGTGVKAFPVFPHMDLTLTYDVF